MKDDTNVPKRHASASQRVLIIGSFANVAGAPVAALRLARGLSERGHAVRATFLYERAPVPSSDFAYDILVPTARPGAGGYLQAARKVHGLIRDYRPDVVISMLPLAHVLAQGSAMLRGVGRRIAAHRSPIDTYDAPLRQVDMALAWAGGYTAMSAVSQATMESCRRYPRRLLARSRTIHNALLDWPRSRLGREEARASFGLAPDKVVLAAVGRHSVQKNYGILVDVARKLDPKFVIAIAGDGPLRAEFEARAAAAGVADRFVVLGAVPRERVADLLLASDIYIMPSIFEGHSNALLEALTVDRPIVAHDIAEQREVLVGPEGRQAGLLVPLNDVDGWVEAIRSLDDSPDLVARLCAEARIQDGQFSFSRMIDKYEELIMQAA